jgi:uncharacterized protein (TIGR02453 family)
MNFPAETLRFLRALKRNNRREWFNAHRGDNESFVRQPMTDIVERLAVDLRAFAPEIVASPKVSIYRVYRDTRFSDNKTPYKTHAAAVFPTRGLAKHEGAGLYFHISPEELWIGGGMYSPQPPQLFAVRQHIAGHFKQFRTIVESPAFRKRLGGVEGSTLKRVPRGFVKDHPAAAYLKLTQLIAGAELPPETATSPAFYKTLLTVFRQIVPFARFLNTPLLKG